jgi:hypothetical protein
MMMMRGEEEFTKSLEHANATQFMAVGSGIK